MKADFFADSPIACSLRIAGAVSFGLLLAAARAQTANPSDPLPLPTLSTKPVWVEGQRILIKAMVPESAWPLRIKKGDSVGEYSGEIYFDGAAFQSNTYFYLGPQSPEWQFVDLTNLNSGSIYSKNAKKLPDLGVGEHRVAIGIKSPSAMASRLSEANVTDRYRTQEISFRVVAAGSPEAKALESGPMFDGKTLEEWLGECASMNQNDRKLAVKALGSMGAPAVEPLMEIIEQGDPRINTAALALREIGLPAAGALPRLIALAKGKPGASAAPASERPSVRFGALSALGGKRWDAESVVPVLESIASNPAESENFVRAATQSLNDIGAPAVPAMERLLRSENPLMHRMAAGYLADQSPNSKAYYAELVRSDPFNPSTPDFLLHTKDGAINNGYVGKSHPLSQEMIRIYRSRLQVGSDPQIAWNLARVIQAGMSGADLQWSSEPIRFGYCQREDPEENNATLEFALAQGFDAARPGSDLYEKLGTGLAKVRLLRGDWKGMNDALVSMGQRPIADEERPWLAAPPKNWTDIGSKWTRADDRMITGDCALEMHFEKDGRPLAGVHVVLKGESARADRFRRTSGLDINTILGSSGAISAFDDPSKIWEFGYSMETQRDTRYAVSDETGAIRFEKLPAMQPIIEILVPTGNFTGSERDWELLTELRPGVLVSVHIDPSGYSPELKPGKTIVYPKIVVRARDAKQTLAATQ